jgi:hypothetical protein
MYFEMIYIDYLYLKRVDKCQTFSTYNFVEIYLAFEPESFCVRAFYVHSCNLPESLQIHL